MGANMTGMFAAVRAIHFVSLMSLWGASAYLWLLGRAKMEVAQPQLRFAGIAASILALATAILWLLLVTGQMSGDWGEALDPQALIAVLRETRLGHIWLARLLGLILLCALAFVRVRIGILAVVAGLALASLGSISHAAASGGPARAVNDAIHLLTAGFWVGSLVALAELCRLHRHECRVLVAPFRLFSLWGVYAVTLLVLSGLVNAAAILPLHALTPKSAYADVLGVKVVLALAMIALAAVNRSQLLPALRNGEKDALLRLRRNVAGEIALGASVIAIVGYLGLMPPS